mgnify:CR=1 FL=1
MTERFSYSLNATDGKARTGVISTPRGEIRTPAFMPVGTAATVKAMLPESVAATGADILLGNTYHLMLRPGAERVERLGGLHRFMNWDKPILTDSGGFQVMSLSELRKLTEEGVTFRSHVDGSKHVLSPETSMEIQRQLGSDIVMCFDECPALPADEAIVAQSMRLSMRWAQRSRDAFGDRPGHALFGIQQGGVTEELRGESAEALRAIGFGGKGLPGVENPADPRALAFVGMTAWHYARAQQAGLVPEPGTEARSLAENFAIAPIVVRSVLEGIRPVDRGDGLSLDYLYRVREGWRGGKQTGDLLIVRIPPLEGKSRSARAMRDLFIAGAILIAEVHRGITEKERAVLKGFLGEAYAIDKLDSAKLASLLPQRITDVKNETAFSQRMQVIRDLCLVANADKPVATGEILVLNRIAVGLEVPLSFVEQSLDIPSDLD